MIIRALTLEGRQSQQVPYRKGPVVMSMSQLYSVSLVVTLIHMFSSHSVSAQSASRTQPYNSSSCADNDFSCRDQPGLCIPRIKWQDGIRDCDDGSDEECLRWQYDCKFGKPRCVDLRTLNDNSIDCMSAFDEACPAHYFVCMDQSDCISPTKYLDGNIDCADASDEPCAAAHFLCHDRSRCVPFDRFQDGKIDCVDGSDEECTPVQHQCSCGVPRCINMDRMDDGVVDCADGSDEQTYVVQSVCENGDVPRLPPKPINGSQSLVPSLMDQCAVDDICNAQLNEICVTSKGSRRCVCRLRHIRPHGHTKCVSVEEIVLVNPRAASLTLQLSDSVKDVPVLTSTRPAINTNNLAVNKQETRETLRPSPISLSSSTSLSKGSAGCVRGTSQGCAPNEVCQQTSDGQQLTCECAQNYTRDARSGQCTALIDECASPDLNECDENALCMDNPLSFECLCRQGYIDMSPMPSVKPGINCLPLIDECSNAGANDCSPDAICIDLPGNYLCQCKPGYVDLSPLRPQRPGRVCQKRSNECALGLSDCDPRAMCTDTDKGYNCRCRMGFVDMSDEPVRKPGRKCTIMQNECENATLNNCDVDNGQCVDTTDGHECSCKSGYVDMEPNRPGTKCMPSGNPCLDYTLHDCDRQAICESSRAGFFECKCPQGFTDASPDVFRFPGRVCRKKENECLLGTAQCDPNAECVDTDNSYSCRCRQGWSDVSPNQQREPGRKCRKGQSCRDLQCASQADCRETSNGPVCQCKNGYVDVSQAQGLPAGRTCSLLVNECRQRTSDCSQNAQCIDTASAFTCRCFDGYRDESPDKTNRPGRLCVQAFVPAPAECDVRDPLSCDTRKFEVCLFVDGTYKCRCPNGFSRLPDGRCKVINECADQRFNDCSENSQCIDQAESYTCQCRPGFVDVSPDSSLPGRQCRMVVDECRNPTAYNVDCHTQAVCVDQEDGFQCRCLPGYADVSEQYNMLPGRVCVQAINECTSSDTNDCSVNAICDDAKIGYTCRCKNSFVDVSANITAYPGRVCSSPKDNSLISNDQFQIETCDPNNQRSCKANSVCTDRSARGRFVCECGSGFQQFEGSCIAFTQCSSNSNNDCDQNAQCTNSFNSFECQCRPGFLDLSPDPIRRPGRVCKQLINECADRSLNDCDPNAMCKDARDGFLCMCPTGYSDVSSFSGLKPGRRCVNGSDECTHRSLNTCDDNADCVNTLTGYECVCIPGFFDVSSSANLAPGRVCSVYTTCPKQATDLMFLVDGSGSIGTFTFRNEVLRFVREFVELFDVGPDNTRIGIIQYSEQIRHEFDLNAYQDQIGVLQGISDIKYMTGLTNTGLAIQHMVQEGYSAQRGARINQDNVASVAIVITDGRSQDAVSEPARIAREQGIQLFVIGVTDHVKDSELEEIAGSKDRYFHVKDFTDLNTRLRSLVQKAVCPSGTKPPTNENCDPVAQTGCDRGLNEICQNRGSRFTCECPDGWQRNPLTNVCGGEQCNPNIKSLCAHPSTCKLTPYQTFRCNCPLPYKWHPITGTCSDQDDSQRICNPQDNSGCPENQQCQRGRDGRYSCVCKAGFVYNTGVRRCVQPDWCDPNNPNDCDRNKYEQCLPSSSGYNKCQCPPQYYRHPVTAVCLFDECITGKADCDRNAKCEDTDDSFLCKCNSDYIDISPDPIRKPGRVCSLAKVDECKSGTNNCSVNARCIDIDDGFLCECKPGYIDQSPNQRQFPGLVCDLKVDECADPSLNTCHPNAICQDTDNSYTCFCDQGYTDLDPLRQPGRNCRKKFEPCQPGNNDCDKNAKCVAQGDNAYTCQCPANYRDRSPQQNLPGRVCIPVIYECDNPASNDCDSPDKAICTDIDDGFLCRCRPDFVDISPDPQQRPGRQCQRLTNECQLGTHDCAREGGVCDDTPQSFTCRCDGGYLDVSLDRNNRPGRQCKKFLDECSTGLNECDSVAECIDTEDSYVCRCKQGYEDLSPDPVARPGRRCAKLVNECLDDRLNDCSQFARCVDTAESYRCQCTEQYNDQSPDRNRPGRICTPKLVDECRSNTDDCSVDATCEDRASGFTCVCNIGFIDKSPNRVTKPGRVCDPKPTPPPPECFLERQDSCRADLNEVCRLVNGQPKCGCPENYSRNSALACTVINECLFPQLHDCSPSATCIDQATGYTCQCKAQFIDQQPSNPGRFCEPLVPECQFETLNDCHQYANCIEQDQGYNCACKPGYTDKSTDPSRPGRICQQIVNECENPSLNTCDPNAQCTDLLLGYECACNQGYYDTSITPSSKGRSCRRIVNECLDSTLNDCHRAATCTDTLESYKCDCPSNSRDISPNPQFPGRVCLVFLDECNSGQNDCDRNALCRDTEDSFTCTCKQGYTDRSPTRSRPGRVCKEVVDECQQGLSNCAPNADCRDLEDGYTCECKDGYVDRSPDLSQPGRVCGNSGICPQNNDCSSAAVCEPKGGGDFDCICIQGYVDQSPSGRPGRVCVRVNDCLHARRNDCSKNAMCINHGSQGKYSCACKFDYDDVMPERPGRFCRMRNSETRTKLVQPAEETDLTRMKQLQALKHLTLSTTTTPKQTTTKPATTKRYSPRVIPIDRLWIVGDNECRDPRQNNCSRNAICYDLSQGYRCECIQGYTDRSPTPTLPGRICEPVVVTLPPVPPCQDPSRNDCHYLANCRSILGSADQYTCECPSGYSDRSPDPRNPGRICVPDTEVCVDPNKNDCDEQGAACIKVSDSRKFTCQCRDGYIDKSRDSSRPGRICERLENECLDARLNDCASNAICEDQLEGFTCRCPSTAIDQSPDRQRRPGRVCTPLLNECQTRLHNCSRFADCIDTQQSYDCRCRSGYHDNLPSQPGRECQFIINECESPTQNDCHPQALCIDELGGYTCQCKAPYRDESPDRSRAPGRRCLYNECNDPSRNDCSPNADCIDTEASFACFCKAGYVDLSPDPRKQGRRCDLALSTPAPLTTTTLAPDDLRCGQGICKLSLGETCDTQFQCKCQIGFARQAPGLPCKQAVKFTLPLYVQSRGSSPLQFTTDYGNPNSAPYIDITGTFEDGLGRQIERTPVAQKYVTTETEFLNPPGLYNSSWQQGLMFNYSVYLTPDHGLSGNCDLFKIIIASLQQTNLRIGGTDMTASRDQPPVCPVERPTCGNSFCDPDLGEICIGNQVCGCPAGQKRQGPGTLCRNTEPYPLMLYVIRDGLNYIDYSNDFQNPTSDLYRQYVDRFIAGLNQVFASSPTLGGLYVSSDVSFVQDPSRLNGTWTQGLLYNFTVNMIPSRVESSQVVWTEMMRIIQGNANQIGTSQLFINPYQINPFSSCFNNDCDKNAICYERGSNSYTCTCAEGFVDMTPVPTPGRLCRALNTINECERPELTDCHENARCLDLSIGYECRCLAGFKDITPDGNKPGTLCANDFCRDVDFCSVNQTCANLEQQARCQCNAGFIDIRTSSKRVSLGLEAQECLSLVDVDECALGLTDCQNEAICTDLRNGYECQCANGWIDGNPANPGRICSTRFADQCSQQGDCVHNEGKKDCVCVCYDGFSGDRCQVASADVRFYLVLILAIIFLLLMLCCLMYFCCKCSCVDSKGLWYREPLFTYRKTEPWTGSTSSESGADIHSGITSKGSEYYPQLTIPRAKLRNDLGAYLNDGHYDSESMSSEYTVREEVERRVITDTRKIVTNNTAAEVHQMSSSSAAASGAAAGAAGASSMYAESRRTESESATTATPAPSTSCPAETVSQQSHEDTSQSSLDRDRGQSEAAFSVGGITQQTATSTHWEDGNSYNQDRAMSEYTEDQSEETMSQDSRSVSERDAEMFDKKVLVKNTQAHEPDLSGRSHGTDRYKQSVTTTQKSKEFL